MSVGDWQPIELVWQAKGGGELEGVPVVVEVAVGGEVEVAWVEGD